MARILNYVLQEYDIAKNITKETEEALIAKLALIEKDNKLTEADKAIALLSVLEEVDKHLKPASKVTGDFLLSLLIEINKQKKTNQSIIFTCC